MIEIAQSINVPYQERFFNLFEVWTAREVFICGTGAEIVGVRTVDGRPIGDGAVGPVTRRFIERYAEVVRTTGTPIGRAEPVLVNK